MSLQPSLDEDVVIPSEWVAGVTWPVLFRVTDNHARAFGVLPGDVVIGDRTMGRSATFGQLVIVWDGDSYRLRRFGLGNCPVFAFYVKFDPVGAR